MPASAKTTAKRSRTEETAPSSAPPTKQPATQPGFIQLFVEYYVEPEEGGRLSNTALKALIGKITGKPIKGNDGTVSAAMGARYKEYQGGTVSEKSAKEAQLERYSIRTKGGTDTEFIGVRITPSPSASAKSKAKLEQMQKLHPHAALTSGVKMSRLYAAEVKLAAPQKTKASSKADKIFPQYSGRKRDVSSLQGAANTFAPRTVGGFYEFIVESGLSTVQKVTQNGHILRLTLRRLTFDDPV